MNSKPLITLKRMLALLLVLAMGAVLPAMGEGIAIDLESNDEAAVPEVEGLEIEALPELSDVDLELSNDLDLELSNDLDLELESVEPNTDVENTSKPIPTYQSLDYTLTLGINNEINMNLQDSLTINSGMGNIVRWVVNGLNKDNVIKIMRARDSLNSLIVKPIGVGSVIIRIALETGTMCTVALRIRDALALKGLDFTSEKVTMAVGQDIDLMQLIKLKPEYARSKLNLRVADESMFKFNGFIARAVKAGQTRIIVTDSITGKNDNLIMNVLANATPALHDKPTSKDVGKLKKKWTLWPKTLELNGDGTVDCSLWLLNDSDGKLIDLNNLDLEIKTKDNTGNTLVARSAFKSVKVDCAENQSQVVKLTFPASKIYCPTVAFITLKPEDLIFQLYGTPSAVSTGKDKAPDYVASEIKSDTPQPNPVKYRALLISESDFYNPREKDENKRWEHSKRNMGDVKMMKKMLKRVKTPDGSKYSVTTQNNTSLASIKRLIKKTFAGADENDVSLFFIATHGDSSDTANDNDAGSLRMASFDESTPEWLDICVLRDLLLEVPGKVIVFLQSCGSGAAVYASNGGSRLDALAQAAQAFDARVIDAFRDADPGVEDSGYAANTGELRRANKFYVLTASAYREESMGFEKLEYNVFTDWLDEGVGKSGDMPADKKYAGNNNGMVDLHELYRYISNVGDRTVMKREDHHYYYQHVQVYPANLRYTLFK